MKSKSNFTNTLGLYGGKKMNSVDLKSNQYCIIANRKTGKLRTERGEKLIYRKVNM